MNKEKLSKPVAIRWAMVVAAGKVATVTVRVKKLDKPKHQATGTPKANRLTKLNTKIKMLNHSIASF